MIPNHLNTVSHRQLHNRLRKESRIRKSLERKSVVETVEGIDEILNAEAASRKESNTLTKQLKEKRKELVVASGGIKRRAKGKATKGKPLPDPAELSNIPDLPEGNPFGTLHVDDTLDPALEPPSHDQYQDAYFAFQDSDTGHNFGYYSNFASSSSYTIPQPPSLSMYAYPESLEGTLPAREPAALPFVHNYTNQLFPWPNSGPNA